MRLGLTEGGRRDDSKEAKRGCKEKDHAMTAVGLGPPCLRVPLRPSSRFRWELGLASVYLLRT